MRVKQQFMKRPEPPVMEAAPVESANGPSRSRIESNAWLRQAACDIEGDILSIGSRDDADGEGGRYRDYFASATSYTTSDVTGGADLALDVRDMFAIEDGRFTGVFCSGVLEHVDDFRAGVDEITRILAVNGILLLGVPFRQAIHDAPGDYWRFTRHGVEYLLRDAYDILDIAEIDAGTVPGFPAAYWVKARKKTFQTA